jgi:phosphoglycerate dehydrogenase-like enzyme
MTPMTTNVLICSYLEPELVERIRRVDSRLNVQYHPELLPEPRYPTDHLGAKLQRSEAEQARWQELLGQAEILFDFDDTDLARLPGNAPQVKGIQASSAGIGTLVKRHDLGRMNTVFTTASGVHARPLAEFVLMVMLQHVKQAALARKQQAGRVWESFLTDELGGKTLGIVGYGRIGQEVAALARAFGMRISASKRHTAGVSAEELGLDALYGSDQLHELLGEADFVCLITPHTPETEGMMDAAAFAAMKRGAMLINIGRGAAVIEADLLGALDSGHLAQAALDVTAVEPLPADSPLWNHPQVTLYPHSATNGARENERLTELFCANLRRYLAGEPLLNELDVELMY